MIYTPQQIQELLKIVDYHASFASASTLGADVLTDYDKFILNQFDVDIAVFTDDNVPYYQNYLWGKLSVYIGEANASQVEYEDLIKYISRGQYVPLSKVEKLQYDLARNRTYGGIQDFYGKLRRDISGTISEEQIKKRDQYEKVLHDEMEAGVLERKSITSIVSNIGHKFERWDKDWGRIVETEANDIFQLGRTEQLRQDKGADSLVYKDVYSGACRFCIQFYLTNGVGSAPMVFKLEELVANGSNRGRRQKEWKPVVESTHPYCRCDVRHLPDGYEWDEETKSFRLQKLTDKTRKVKRKSKVRIKIGDKELFI